MVTPAAPGSNSTPIRIDRRDECVFQTCERPKYVMAKFEPECGCTGDPRARYLSPVCREHSGTIAAIGAKAPKPAVCIECGRLTYVVITAHTECVARWPI